jgi:nitrate/nitrite transporter NarK
MGIVGYIAYIILAIPFIMIAVGVTKPDYDWLILLGIFGIYPALFLGGILFFLFL